MTERKYSAVAAETTLGTNATSSITTIQVNATTGFPLTTPYTLVIDADLSTAEIVTVTEVAGLELTVVRGEDGTTAQAHSSGSSVRHLATARDLREPQQHIEASTNVHGLGPTAAVVGTDTAQVLTGKEISGLANTITDIAVESVTGLEEALLADDVALAAEAATRAAADTANANAIAAEATARAAADLSAILLAAPPGVINPYAGASAPSGWLLCDGSAVSRTTYAALFAVVSTTFNTGGEAGTDFRLPNLKGKIPVGIDSAQSEFNTRGETGGEKTHTLVDAEMPSHTHNGTTASNGSHSHDGGASSFTVTAFTSSRTAGAGADGALVTSSTAHQTTGAHTHTFTTASAGGDDPHNNLQPYIALHYIIKT